MRWVKAKWRVRRPTRLVRTRMQSSSNQAQRLSRNHEQVRQCRTSLPFSLTPSLLLALSPSLPLLLSLSLSEPHFGTAPVGAAAAALQREAAMIDRILFEKVCLLRSRTLCACATPPPHASRMRVMLIGPPRACTE